MNSYGYFRKKVPELKTLYLDGLNQELKDIQKLLHCHLPFKEWYMYFVIGSRNMTITTIKLLKKFIYMTSNFQIIDKIHKFFYPEEASGQN